MSKFRLGGFCAALVAAGLLCAAAARADTSCTALPGTIDRLACGDAALTEQLAMLQRAFEKIAADLKPDDRQALTLQQEDWKRRPLPACDIIEAVELADTEKRDCLARMTSSRLEKIEAWQWLGRSQTFGEDADAKALCDGALARSNIHWRTTRRGSDEYEIGMAAGLSEPAWQDLGRNDIILREASFDFDNSGRPKPVFFISLQDKRISSQWYIVAVPEEVDLLRQKMRDILQAERPANALRELAADLQFPVRDRRWSTFNGGMFAREDGHEPSLKSRLYDASNTDTYEGWYTMSRAIRFAEKTYLLAASSGNVIEPSVAIFRPRPDGAMTLVCSHKAIPGTARRDVEILDQAQACPVDLPQRRIPWEGDESDTKSAILDLPEWGGRRPVEQWSGSVGPELRTELSIGKVGASVVDEANVWPMSAVDENYLDTVELILTEAGPYVEATNWIPVDPTDDRPMRSLFYRIDGDKLIPVCKATVTPVAPPGYAHDTAPE